MRLKSADGPLQAVHNGNNDILNSPKRINTIQNSNYTQNTQNTTLYNNVTTNEINNVTKNIQQLTIEDVAALNNVHNDTQELRWCKSDLTSIGGHDQQQLNYQRQLALSNLANNRLNINSNLAARLRLRAQNAQNAPITFKDCQMPQSPDDIAIDEDEIHQSCSSSTSVSPQDEDRAFDPSDSADSSDEGNDYSRPGSTDIRPNTLKGFVNPNYPGFQHLAHTLDFDDETLNNANNNNEDYELADKFDSVNRLDSVENIQKVFHDKSLDIDVDRVFPNATETDQDSPNGSSSANCDSESDVGTNDNSASNDDSAGTVNENFNIRLDEKKVFGLVEKAVVKDDQCQRDEVTVKDNDIKQSEIVKIDNLVDSDKETIENGTTTNGSDIPNFTCHNVTQEEKCIDSVVGNLSKEIEDELGRVCATAQPHLTGATETELEEAVGKLQVLTNFQPSATKYFIQPNTDQPFSKESSPEIAPQPLLCENIKLPTAGDISEQMVLADLDNTKTMSSSLHTYPAMDVDDIQMSRSFDSRVHNQSDGLENSIITKTLSNVNEIEAESDFQIQIRPAQNCAVFKNKISETSNKICSIQDRKVRKPVPSFLPLNQTTVQVTASSILSPIENKMVDATLSNCEEHISRIVVERPKAVEENHGAFKPTGADPKLLSLSKTTTSEAKSMEVDDKVVGEACAEMEVDKRPSMVDMGRRDSNRELEEIEIQIKKIKSDTICNMKEADRFRKEDLTKSFKEKDDDSALLRRNPPKVNSYVKKRRDYNSQFGSLITFPKRDQVKRDPLNRRSVPIVKDRKKITNPEYLGGFDVYNIETAMPKIDLEAIESHLRAAREEERRRRTDREEIRRRLAMGSEDDYYSDRPGRKPSLQARLQSGMNLQICFMNETVSDSESPTSDNECPLTNPKPPKTLKQNTNQNQKNGLGNVQQPVQRPATLSLHPAPPPLLGGSTSETDFFTKQARLQTEARMALAQAKEMARMQMEIERQRQKKSPITEMVRHSLEKVGIPFPEEKRRLSRQILTEMNVAQLQVIVNDLHTQIETLNEQLVKFLMDRDDLHMEQDSMLVDIEDLTRYLGAKEQVIKEQSLAPTPQNNNLLPPPSPAPSSPLAALNSTVRPHLNRIASLVKK